MNISRFYWSWMLALTCAILILISSMCTMQTRLNAIDRYIASVRVTHYDLNGVMYNGEWVHEGAAACSWNFELGTVIQFRDGWQVVCKDRGALGWSGWIDVWGGSNVVAGYGPYEVVEVWE